MYAGAFLLWKREGNDDIINSASDMEKIKNVAGNWENGRRSQ